jgi:hypothetical protein
MTTILSDRQAAVIDLTDGEVDELCRLTASLPQLIVGGYTAPLPLDPAMRLDAALWQVAQRAGVDVGCQDTVFDVVDRLTSDAGWSSGPARDALRAYTMLRWSAGRDLRAAARVIAYLELRARFG